MDLTAKEWQDYVKLASGGEWPIPQNFISDYDNWVCRSIVGRALYFRGNIEEAIQVLSTVVDVIPSEEYFPDKMGEVEHKILCLRDLGRIIWQLTKNKEASLRFWQEAIALAKSWQHPFHSLNIADLEKEAQTVDGEENN